LRRNIFVVASTGSDKLLVDDGDRQATGMIGFHRVRQLKQFLLGDLGVGERAISLNFIELFSFRLR
jgi:hypothetical protein